MGRLPRRRLHGRLRLESLTLRRSAPVVAVALVAAAWLMAAPPVADLAAHVFRAGLFEREGFAVWNLQWYGGHHVPGYSLLFGPLAAELGAREAIALSGVAAAAALVALVGDRPAAAWLLASGAAANLAIGRGPFALGVTFAALALLLRDRTRLAIAFGLLTAAASPVAALFLCLAGAALARPALVIAPASLVLTLAVMFPEGGAERFVATAFWPMLALALACAWLLPGRWRVAAGLYALLLVGAFVLETPVGHNATRLGVLAGPAALVIAGRGPRPALIAVGAALLYLNALPAVRALAESQADPAAVAAFHAPLIEFLDRADGPPGRVEIVMTRNHWEAAHVAWQVPLARGWERQLDVERNALFYDGSFSENTYEAWLRREAIRWVALPDAPLDYSAREEAALLRRGVPYLVPAFDSQGWKVWRLLDAPPTVEGPGHLTETGPQTIVLYAQRAGRLRTRFRTSRYWRVIAGPGRLVEGTERLAVDALRPGVIRLEARLFQR